MVVGSGEQDRSYLSNLFVFSLITITNKQARVLKIVLIVQKLGFVNSELVAGSDDPNSGILFFLAHQIQLPIPKQRVLKFHEFFNQKIKEKSQINKQKL